MADQPQDLSWHDAIVHVLAEAGKAMHYTDIAAMILARGLRSTPGATPANTVSAIITTNINTRGKRSDFLRTGRGEYILRDQADRVPLSTTSTTDEQQQDEEEEEPSAVDALGMFWRRELVVWTSNPVLLGQQQRGASVVDFSDQRGVYLLHDGRDTVYVGRVTDQGLGKRLSQHTSDRLNGRWDRFSWFGLREVTEDGQLRDKRGLGLGVDQVIIELEAVLIESLEPSLNRRRGDGLRAVEYIQVEDPAVKQRQMLALMSEMQNRMLGHPVV